MLVSDFTYWCASLNTSRMPRRELRKYSWMKAPLSSLLHPEVDSTPETFIHQPKACNKSADVCRFFPECIRITHFCSEVVHFTVARTLSPIPGLRYQVNRRLRIGVCSSLNEYCEGRKAIAVVPELVLEGRSLPKMLMAHGLPLRLCTISRWLTLPIGRLASKH